MKINGKEIELKNPKGRHTKKGFQLLLNVQHKSEDPEALTKYLNFVDEMASEISGMTVEELDELDKKDKDKIREYCANKINGEADFLKSSLKPASSGPKVTTK